MVVDAADASGAHGTLPAKLPAYVRKSETSEILVDDWRTDGPRSHVVTVRWPRAHPFYTLDGGATSPLLLTESVRQALAVLSHTAHRIPLDHRLAWERTRSSVAAAAFRPGRAPMSVRVHITHTEVVRSRGGSVRLTAQVRATGGDAYLGGVHIRYLTLPPRVYRRLRGRYADAATAFARALPPGPAAPAHQVGRARARDVVLSPAAAPHRWRLRADTTHRVLFDHPHDHLPGMVLLEAAAQAAQAEAGPGRVLPVAFDTVFDRYVELDRPCWIGVEPAAPDPRHRPRWKVCAVQDDRVVCSTLVATEPLDGGARPDR